MKNPNWEQDAVRCARNNHIWLNAFSCVRPGPEFCRQLGEDILRIMSDPGNCIEPENHLTAHEKELVIRISST